MMVRRFASFPRAAARSLARRIPLCLALVALAGCASPVDTTENKLPPPTVPDTTPATEVSEVEVGEVGEVEGDTVVAGCECLAIGQWFRFDSLVLTSIDGADHPVLSTLNGLWKADIEGRELNILMELTAVSATSVTARVVNGARIDGTQDICQISDTAVTLTFPRSGCDIAASAESAFNVYSGTETYPKNCSTTLPVHHVIPVSRARLAGTFSETCDAIGAGKVPSGGLGQSELDDICTCLVLPGTPAEDCGALEPAVGAPCPGCNKNYQSLGNLLTAFGDVAWSCTTESGAPAACLTADYSAAALTAAPSECTL